MPSKRPPTKPPRKTRSSVVPFKRRPRGKPFKKGDPKPANSGRRKGTGNQATTDMRQFLSAFVEGDAEYQENLKVRLREGRGGNIELLAHHYSGGKPKETVAHEGEGMAHFLAVAAARGLGNGS